MNQHYYYRSFGLLIHSEFELPGIPAVCAHDAPDVVIRRGAVTRPAGLATLREEVAIHAAGASFLIRDGREITVDIRPELEPAVLSVLLLGRVMAFLFRQRGWLPLHASGVVIGDQCALFLGIAHAGKSTTAAAFYKRHHAVVTDDVAPVRIDDGEGCVLQSGWSHLRLRDDAQVLFDNSALASSIEAGKRRYNLNSSVAPGGLYSVRCAYVLEYGDEIRVDTVDPAEAIPLLSLCSFVMRQRMGREALDAHLRDCCAVAGVLPVRRVIRPRSLTRLPELVRFIEEDIRSLKVPARDNRVLPIVPA